MSPSPYPLWDRLWHTLNKFERVLALSFLTTKPTLFLTPPPLSNLPSSCRLRCLFFPSTLRQLIYRFLTRVPCRYRSFPFFICLFFFFVTPSFSSSPISPRQPGPTGDSPSPLTPSLLGTGRHVPLVPAIVFPFRRCCRTDTAFCKGVHFPLCSYLLPPPLLLSPGVPCSPLSL